MSQGEQIANMMVCMGPESVGKYDQLVYNDDSHERMLVNVTADFDQYCRPVKNVTYIVHVYEQMMYLIKSFRKPNSSSIRLSLKFKSMLGTVNLVPWSMN